MELVYTWFITWMPLFLVYCINRETGFAYHPATLLDTLAQASLPPPSHSPQAQTFFEHARPVPGRGGRRVAVEAASAPFPHS